MKVPTPRKLKSGSYNIQLRLNGESISITAPTAKECTHQATLIKAEHISGVKRRSRKDEMTLRDTMEKYIDDHRPVLSPETTRGYGIIMRNRFQDYADMKISAIKDWQALVNAESAKLSPKTVENSVRFLRSALKHSGFILPPVKLPQNPAPDTPYLNPDEVKRFIECIKGDDLEIPALLALHSLRSSEIAGLDWEDIDLKNGFIHVRGARVRDEHNKFVDKDTNKNLTSSRDIPIIIPQLAAACAAAGLKSGRVMTCAPNTLYRRINRICRDAGLPEVGVHGLRRTFVSLCVHEKVPEDVTMRIGGWSDIKVMHEHYAKFSAETVRELAFPVTSFFEDDD